MIKQPESVTLFISYAHEDEKLRQELEAHLKGLERRRLISIWHDRQITAGAERVQTIDAHLEQADSKEKSNSPTTSH